MKGLKSKIVLLSGIIFGIIASLSVIMYIVFKGTLTSVDHLWLWSVLVLALIASGSAIANLIIQTKSQDEKSRLVKSKDR
ncbi:hypothetical protein ACVR1G_08920 [Streptococcus dentasini]